MISRVDDRDHDHGDDHDGVHRVCFFYFCLAQMYPFDDHLDEHPTHFLVVLIRVDQLLHLFVQVFQLLHIQNHHDRESIHQPRDFL